MYRAHRSSRLVACGAQPVGQFHHSRAPGIVADIQGRERGASQQGLSRGGGAGDKECAPAAQALDVAETARLGEATQREWKSEQPSPSNPRQARRQDPARVPNGCKPTSTRTVNNHGTGFFLHNEELPVPHSLPCSLTCKKTKPLRARRVSCGLRTQSY
jgi:hypothetical protein